MGSRRLSRCGRLVGPHEGLDVIEGPVENVGAETENEVAGDGGALAAGELEEDVGELVDVGVDFEQNR
jgi:hypothetical protein